MSENENDLRQALDAANRALEWQCKKIKQLTRERDESLRWEEKYREQIRDSRGHRHHDVLCLVLKAYLDGSPPWSLSSEDAVDKARELADLAYPPPKAVSAWPVQPGDVCTHCGTKMPWCCADRARGQTCACASPKADGT